jgi:hypothetical protein
MPINTNLFNKINNIVDPNIDVPQSKVLIDLFLVRLLEEERKIDTQFFLK